MEGLIQAAMVWRKAGRYCSFIDRDKKPVVEKSDLLGCLHDVTCILYSFRLQYMIVAGFWYYPDLCRALCPLLVLIACTQYHLPFLALVISFVPVAHFCDLPAGNFSCAGSLLRT